MITPSSLAMPLSRSGNCAGARYTATAVNPKTKHNWVSVPQNRGRDFTLITKAAQLWLDKHRAGHRWRSQNGTDKDSWQVFTVPLYMATAYGRSARTI